jgi:hypothetical protein
MSFVLNFKNWSRVNEDAMAGGNNGAAAFNQITKAMSVWDGTDEEGVKKGVFMIKNIADYTACLKLVKAEGYNTIMAYIATDMSWGDEYDEDQAAPIKNWGQLDNNPYLNSFYKHLQQFSKSENIVM